MKTTKKSNKTILLILGLVMVINALSYGTIIPLMYPYASRFGIDSTGLGLLFMSYSLFQFLATPIIGRLSDRFGRKPLLLISLFGTSVSLALFAGAQSVAMLFVARILDGITGGNMSVAQAVIADTTTGEERAKAFGIVGASFGFGFLVGPALGGILSTYGLTVPFWFAAALALAGTILGMIILPETLKTTQIKAASSEPLFNFGKMLKALAIPVIGTILLINLASSTAHAAFIIGFQTVSVDVLRLSTTSIGLLFAGFGVVSIVMQGFGIAKILHLLKNNKILLLALSLITSTIVMLVLYLQASFIPFAIVTFMFAVTFAPTAIVLPGIISEQTKAEDQGGMLGLNAAYMSMGQIIGPGLAGIIASVAGPPSVFLGSALLFGLSFLIGQQLKPTKTKADL